MSLPLNFSAPTGQVQNTYAVPTRVNPYLTSSQYNGMQLHTPSGLYYQGGTVYEPFTPKPVSNYFGFPYYNTPTRNPFSTRDTNDEKDKSIKIGDQYFRPFTGNAQGIIDGNLSMVSMLNQQPTYQPQPMANLFPSLNTSLLQSQPTGDMSGAGRFLGLLNSPTINTQGK